MNKICILSTGHAFLDDRIYYKEVKSLLSKYDSIVLVMPGNKDAIVSEEGIQLVPLRKPNSTLSRLLLMPQILKVVLTHRPEICHFHDYELIFAMPFIRMFSQCKIIYDVHEVYPEMVLQSRKVPKIMRPYLSKAVDITEKIFSRLADYIITSDENISVRFSYSTKVSTIFNYPKLSLFIPNHKRISELERLYSGKTPIIYQGSISEERGLFTMIEAMSIICIKYPNVILLLVGEMSDDLKQIAVRKIQDRRLQDTIDIIGRVPHDDVVNYISISKIGLVPLLATEKFKKNIPIKQFEYMACGLPVVGSDLPPITSYITEAGSGRVFPAGNAEALARRVLDILQHDFLWKQMSEAGKKAVQEKWNWSSMEKKLFAIYDEMLESS